MAHLGLYKLGGAKGVLKHDERTKNDKVKERKNELIDSERTDLNYNLAPKRTSWELKKHIGQVCEENNVTLSTRKDLNVMASWIITKPKDVAEEDTDRFFKSCYDFLNDRYGNGTDNYVLTASVHLDETTPHLHYAFIPVAEKKDGSKSVSAKILLNRADLKSFHKDLSARITQELGYETHILSGTTIGDGLTVDDLKRKDRILDNQNKMLEAEKKAESIRQLDTVRESLECQISDYRAIIERNPVPNAKKGLMGQIRLSEDEFNDLVSYKTEFEKIMAVNDNLRQNIDQLQESLFNASGKLMDDYKGIRMTSNSADYLQAECNRLRDENKNLKVQNKQLVEDNKALLADVKFYHEKTKALPRENPFLSKESQLENLSKQSRYRGFDFEF